MNEEKIKKVERIIFIICVILLVIVSIVTLQKWLYCWLAIFVIMFVGTGVAAFLLDEEPMEFFDNFSKWRNAKCSSVMITIGFISVIAIIIGIFRV